MDRARWVGLVGWAAIAVAAPAGSFGQGTPAAADARLAKVRAAIADEKVPAADRAARALEAAADLDRQANDARAVADRRTRWDQAAGLLDDFVAAHPEVESAPLIRFQAAVYRWALGRDLADEAELAPAEPATRAAAAAQLDRAIAGLRAIGVEPRAGRGDDPMAINVRFRLAQALADRARLEPDGDKARLSAEREAAGLLEPTLANAQIRGFARLLRAELNNRLGQYTQAQIDAEEAERGLPTLDADAWLRARVGALVGRGQFADARKAAAEAGGNRVDPAVRDGLALRVALAERSQAKPGRDRAPFEADAFAVAFRLRDRGGPEATRALLALARAVDEPGPGRPLAWWDLLADAQLRLGNPARAGRMLATGADRAEAADAEATPDREAVAAARMKAGACLFEAGRFAEADALLRKVAESAAASPELKARAGMLAALGKGRAVALKQPGAARADYVRALEEQVARFPGEVSTGEARWLLGKVRRQANRRDDAVALWLAVPRAHARWLESRLAAADALREAVDEAGIVGDAQLVARRMDDARKMLAQAAAEASPGHETVALDFRVAALELTPEVGRGEAALEACDRILKGGASPEQHREARLTRVVALARAGQLIEAERAARDAVRDAEPADLLPPVRWLDRLAGETAADATRRRLGMIDRVFTGRLAQSREALPPAVRDEVRLRVVRGHLFVGDRDMARRELADWGGLTGEAPDGLLRDLADAYVRLESYGLAADAERLRARRLPPGSPPWFEAQYNLALAQFRQGKAKEARRIIDGVAILHPSLGGADLRDRFERLRQRLARE